VVRTVDLDAAILSKIDRDRQEHTRVIGRYYPSVIGNCKRKTYYTYILDDRTNDDLKRIFSVGEALHDFVARALKEDPKIKHCESEVPISIYIPECDFTISGRIDNIVTDENGEERIIEVKSTGQKVEFLKEPKPENVEQLNIYLVARQIQHGDVFYVEKNTLKTAQFPVERDRELFLSKTIKDYAVLDECLREGKLPAPEGKIYKEMAWQCQRCEYKKECEEDING